MMNWICVPPVEGVVDLATRALSRLSDSPKHSENVNHNEAGII